MKKYSIFLGASLLTLLACNKDWTEPKDKTSEFEKQTLAHLTKERDQFKWVAESERSEENKKALDAYFEQLAEYKSKMWLNTGEAGGQKPMAYFWYSGDTWKAEKGFAKSWLQSLPDSIGCISLWGGINKLPEELTENMKKDLEIFHKKGGVVLMCWQTGSSGLGIPGTKDRKVNGWQHFRNKYTPEYDQWAEIYARDLSRFIIGLGLDGYDLDWELTCGDHSKAKVNKEQYNLYMSDNDYENVNKFIKEMAKYFGPKYSGDERKKYLQELFDPNTVGFHPQEKEYIEWFKPYLPSDYLTKRYYFCADIPCGSSNFMKNNFTEYFDKHFMQDYNFDGASTSRFYGNKYYNTTSAEYQKGWFSYMINKARDVRKGEVWGLGAYHGQTDYDNTSETDGFKKYLKENNIKRKYNRYAWTREAIRIADPRPNYSNYKEGQPIIITP